MIAQLVLSAAALAAPQPVATFDRAAATPGETATITVRNVAQRDAVRLYLAPAADAARIRSALDRRLEYVGRARPRSGRATLRFRVPPYGGAFTAWCAGCRARGTLAVAMPAATADSCPTTAPAGGSPPGLRGTSWHGNKALWSFAAENGEFVVPPERAGADGSVGTKLFWFADGLVPVGPLTLAGERLDAASGPLVASQGIRGSATGFRGSATWATRVVFPSAGCWRLRVRVADLRFAVSLSFVMKVAIE